MLLTSALSLAFLLDLPIPELGSYTLKPPPPTKPEPEPRTESGAHISSSPPASRSIPTHQKPEPRATRRQSFGFPEVANDPWASPDLHKGHNHPGTNGTSGLRSTLPASTPDSITGPFIAHSDAPPTSRTESLPPRQPTRTDTGWGSYTSGPAESYRDPALASGFGQPPAGGGDGGDPDPTGLGAAFSAPRITPSSSDEVITVISLPEKEGMFLFQHRNYQVTSARRNSKVIRRYSDFVWLLDCLHKRYPFRQLPLLPPKRVASKYSLCGEVPLPF
jgi:sorting nexin-8